MYPDLDLLHHHGENGLIYRSPRVIYSVDNEGPSIIAVEEGAEELMKVRLLSHAVRMGNTDRTIIDTTLKVSQATLALLHSLHCEQSTQNTKACLCWALSVNSRSTFTFRKVWDWGSRCLKDSEM